jgi:hypothetical protein
MNDHLVIIFAYHYPPENAIGGARPHRFAKYLSKLGYKCRIFTAADQTGRDDPNTEYVPDPFVIYPRHSPRWQIERAIRKFVLPGERGVLWSRLAARAARAYLRAHPTLRVTIFSTFPPLGPHFAAWQLAHSEGLPWIADFRDPLPDRRDFGRTHLLRERTVRWLERVMARRADAIIANTDAAMGRWQEKFPSLNGKIQMIWNGFDPENRVLPLPTVAGDCRVLSHTGELYAGRNATPILESLARLIAAGRLPAGSVRLRLVGSAEPGILPNREFLDRAQAEGWLDLVTKQIPQPEALQIARSSHGLLLLQLRSAFHVPAKIFEYLQIGRPILAFVQSDSPSEHLLARSGVPYRCVYPGSTPETVDDTVAEFFSLSTKPVAASPWFEEHFNAENQTLQLDAIIRSLHKDALPESSELPNSFGASKRTIPNQKTKIADETANGSCNMVRPG